MLAGADGLADAWPVVGHGDNQRGPLPPGDRLGERRVVDSTVVAADEQRHGSICIGAERSLRRQHVGGQAVVDELDGVDRPERTTAAGQSLETPRRMRSGGRVGGAGHTQSFEHGTGEGCVPRVVGPVQTQGV